METENVMMVRLYLARSVERRELLFRRLQQWGHLRGATVFQAVQGFGEHGVARDEVAPSAIEFFDSEQQVNRILDEIAPLVDHVVVWPAKTLVSKKS